MANNEALLGEDSDESSSADESGSDADDTAPSADVEPKSENDGDTADVLRVSGCSCLVVLFNVSLVGLFFCLDSSNRVPYNKIIEAERSIYTLMQQFRCIMCVCYVINTCTYCIRMLKRQGS